MPHPLNDSPIPDPDEDEVIDLEDASGDAVLLESTLDAPCEQDGDAEGFGVQP